MSNNISKNIIKTGIIGLIFAFGLIVANGVQAAQFVSIYDTYNGNYPTQNTSPSYGYAANTNTYANTNTVQNLYTTPTVATNPESNVGDNTATFNGYVSTGGAATSRYFAYGTDANNLNQSTTIKSQGVSNGNISEIVYGLDAGTVYYYQAVAVNTVGTGRGLTLSFKTSGIAPVKKVAASAAVKKTVAKANTKDGDKSGLSAQAISSGTFLPSTLNGWLLLILIIFGLIYFGRKIYKDSTGKNENAHGLQPAH